MTEIPWDTEIDTPATIAIIGAGPYAIEAALYARFLGYSVEIYSRRRVATSLIPWTNVTMPAPAGQVTTPLGRAALEAQENPCELPLDSAVTYGQYLEQYLLPLAKTDLVYDSINIQSHVNSISRFSPQGSTTTTEQRSEQEFRVSVQSQKRGWHSQLFDIVIDASGNPFRSGLAPGGGLACQDESAISLTNLPPKLAVEGNTSEFAGTHTVLVGASAEACLAATQIHHVAKAHPQTKLTWLLPRKTVDQGLRIADELPQAIREVIEEANRLIQLGELPVVALPAWGIEHVVQTDSGQLDLQVRTSAEETLPIVCDSLLHLSERQSDQAFTVCMDTAPLTDTVTSEPHYYVLGSKAKRYQAWSPQMFDEIRQLFGVIGGRADLDLYATVAPKHS